MKRYEADENLFGRKIELCLVDTGDGICTFVFGGDKPHVGAVSTMDGAGTCTTMSFPGHKESVVTEKWVKTIWQRKKAPVTVTAGIHYDNATKEMIQSVIEVTERMLQKVLNEQMETRKGVCENV